MRDVGPNITDPQKSLVECQPPGLPESENIDPPPPYCPDPDAPCPNQRDPGTEKDSWLEDILSKRIDLGTSGLCDPMQTGQIINDLDNPQRNTVYRYSKAIRGCDEAVMDLFRNVVVIDEDGVAHPVPIIWATQERAVLAVVQENIRKDETIVVDRIRLPMLAISSTEFAFNQDRYTYHNAINYLRGAPDADGNPDDKPTFTASEKYERDTVFGVARGLPVDISYTLYAWTLYLEDMNQILEQVFLKFSPIAYIRIRGVAWEVGVKLESVANNLETEPGDKQLRVIKFQFNIKAETYIPQPIVRRKAVLKVRTEFVDGLTEEDITQVIGRLEVAVKELEC
jgi:hypothetical protein